MPKVANESNEVEDVTPVLEFRRDSNTAIGSAIYTPRVEDFVAVGSVGDLSINSSANYEAHVQGSSATIAVPLQPSKALSKEPVGNTNTATFTPREHASSFQVFTTSTVSGALFVISLLGLIISLVMEFSYQGHLKWLAPVMALIAVGTSALSFQVSLVWRRMERTLLTLSFWPRTEIPQFDSKHIFQDVIEAWKSLTCLVEHLNEAYAYLPQAVVDGSNDPNSNQNSNETSSNVTLLNRNMPKMPPLVFVAGSPTRNGMSRTFSGNQLSTRSSGNSSNSMSGIRLTSRVALDMKRCALSMVDWQGFNQLLDHWSLTKILKMHVEYIEELTKTLRTNRATLDRFVGDKMFAIWNSTNPTYCQLACLSALQLESNLKELSLRYSDSPRYSVEFRISVVIGEALSGTLGCRNMRAFSIIGPLVNWCHSLNKAARGSRCGVVVDQNLFNSIRTQFLCHAMDYVDATQIFGETNVQYIYRVVDEHDELGQGKEEWMYEIEKRQDLTQFDRFNTGFHLACEGNYSKGVEMMRKYLPVAASDPALAMTMRRVLTNILSRSNLINHTVQPSQIALDAMMDLCPKDGPKLIKMLE